MVLLELDLMAIYFLFACRTGRWNFTKKRKRFGEMAKKPLFFLPGDLIQAQS